MHSLKLCALAAVLLGSRACFALDEAAVVQSIQKADAAFATSSFRARAFAVNAPAHDISSTRADGKFRYRTVPLNGKGSQTLPMEVLFDGQDEFSTIGDSITISRQDLYSDAPENRMLLLLPGACFFKGRGLSMLQAPHVRAVANSSLVELQGNTPQGEPIRALLDPQQKFLARRIERLGKDGKAFVVIETRGAQSGGLMPLETNVSYPGGNAQSLPQRFQFSAVSFGVRPARPLRFALARPALVADARFGAPLVIRKTTAAPMTKADIFLITDRENAKLNVLKESERAAENKQRDMNLALTFGPLALAALLLAWRTKRV